AVAKNDTVYLDANGSASITPADINNGSTDNCGIASLTLNNASFDCSNIGAGGAPVTPTFIGTVSQNTQSCGSGFNPNTNEFWYPLWRCSAVYKYDAVARSFNGSFNTAASGIMEIWVDKSSTDYFTAEYYNQRMARWSINKTLIWASNMGNYTTAVAADAPY